MGDPCGNCEKKHVECLYPTKDNRSVRLSVSKMEKTQRELENLKNLISSIRQCPTTSAEIHEIIDSGIGRSMELDSEANPEVNSFKDITVPENDVQTSTVFGPMSVFKKYNSRNGSPSSVSNSPPIPAPGSSEPIVRIGNVSYYNFMPHCKTLFDVDVYESISSFFKWQYSSNYLFIHRESFLFHFLQQDFENAFVSEDLIYSIAALGSRFSSKRKLQLKADDYFKQSMEKAFSNSATHEIDFSSATLTRLQSLLCLSFFEISRGNLTSGWLLSGIAFRIGSNIGFERDPSEWENEHPSLHSVRSGYPFDLTVVRRRIYWGTYIADHFISLIFGRYPSLKRIETSIGPSSDLYNLTNIRDFLFYDPVLESCHASDVIVPLEALVTLARISESMLLDVFAPISTTIETDEKRNTHIKQRLLSLQSYNRQLDEWVNSLPPALSVDKQELQQHGHNYVNISARCSYFLTRLSLNRPFAIYSDKFQDNKSLTLCEDTVIQLYTLLQSIDKLYGLLEFEPTIPLVYSIVLGTSVLSLNISRGQTHIKEMEIKPILNFFLKFLEFSSRSLEIAKNAMDVVQATLNTDARHFGIAGGSDPMNFSLEDENLFMETILNGSVIDSVFDPDFFLI